MPSEPLGEAIVRVSTPVPQATSSARSPGLTSTASATASASGTNMAGARYRS